MCYGTMEPPTSETSHFEGLRTEARVVTHLANGGAIYMLKLTFSLQSKMRLKGKCPRHPGYNPEAGQGAIRGACSGCQALYQVIAARDEVYAALRRFESLAEPYKVVRNHPTKT